MKEKFLAATSADTIRSRSLTGKHARMLKSAWTEEWERDDTPDPLPMPLQGYLTFDAVRRTHRYAGAGECQKVAFNPVGQVVGQINEIESCRDIMYRLQQEYIDALEHVNGLLPD